MLLIVPVTLIQVVMHISTSDKLTSLAAFCAAKFMSTMFANNVLCSTFPKLEILINASRNVLGLMEAL